MKYLRNYLSPLCGLALAAVCAQSSGLAADPANPPASTTAKADDPEVAVITTTEGVMVVQFWTDAAPKTIANFKKLAQTGFYDGTCFHRVIKGFMIQTGDVNATGSSPCGIPNLRDEIDPSLNFKASGVLAMANTGSKNTGACQIFITVGPADYLTGMYTIFGQVVSGQDVADAISKVPVSSEKPLVPVIVKTVTTQRKQ